DANTGREIRVTHPPHEFLTPVYFREAVLERYYADPSLYEVSDASVRAGRQWSLDITRTGRGTIHAWLGDIATLPRSVQQHWQPYAVVDAGPIPEVRIRRDLLAQFFDAPAEGPVAELKQAIHELNQIAEARFGAPVYAKLDAMHAQSIRVLRIPANASVDAFAQQVRSLAILVVDHLNPDFLKAMQAPSADGSLNRLALLIRDLAHIDEVAAKDLIGGLYAVQDRKSVV